MFGIPSLTPTKQTGFHCEAPGCNRTNLKAVRRWQQKEVLPDYIPGQIAADDLPRFVREVGPVWWFCQECHNTLTDAELHMLRGEPQRLAKHLVRVLFQLGVQPNPNPHKPA